MLRQSLGSNQDISQKYKMGDMSLGLEWPTHSSPPKKYIKKQTISQGLLEQETETMGSSVGSIKQKQNQRGVPVRR
jgi:hypothetical protein